MYTVLIVYPQAKWKINIPCNHMYKLGQICFGKSYAILMTIFTIICSLHNLNIYKTICLRTRLYYYNKNIVQFNV